MQAHDWQAYQELLAKQKGPEGASERYEVINRFLDDTENYLHKLAGKVANVKLSQEASEAAAQAMAEARAQACLPVCLTNTTRLYLKSPCILGGACYAHRPLGSAAGCKVTHVRLADMLCSN